jgi:hypothetical protein
MFFVAMDVHRRMTNAGGRRSMGRECRTAVTPPQAKRWTKTSGFSGWSAKCGVVGKQNYFQQQGINSVSTFHPQVFHKGLSRGITLQS